MTVKVNVHRERCISSGQCAWYVPEVFDQSDVDGFVQLRRETPPAQSWDAVRDAVHLCPTRAIEVVED